MSIKFLARDLYRYQRQVEALEAELAAADPRKRAGIEQLLRQAKSERDFLKRALDGHIGR